MNLTPRNATLAEALYREIDKNDYLQEIYGDLLYNYSIKLFHTDKRPRDIPVKDALRFADLLSKSSYAPTADRDHLWGQEIAILLRLLYPEDESVKYYLGSVLSAVGNYRGLMSKTIEGFRCEDILDSIYYEYDKEEHLIPGKEEEYFFNDQMKVYYGMKEKFYSYSGPTSMGKSFVVQTFIQQQIENGSTDNFAILVPTKALINEVRSNMIGALQDKLKALNYRVVTASGDLVLQQNHHFIFIMTPERLLHMMIERENICVDFLFIDEAHKISARRGRSSYYFKVLTQLGKMRELPTVIFASPNVPNPDVYMQIIPGIKQEQMKKLISKYAPVCQFKYFLNVPERSGYYYNDYSKQLERCYTLPEGQKLCDIVATVGQDMKYVISALQAAKPMLLKNITDFDSQEFLLNAPDATYDLQDGSSKEHEAEDLITKMTAVSPSEDGMDLWKKALDSFFCGDKELIDYVQQIVGLSAIGKVYVEALVIAYGEGSNGKSTFWNTIARVLGTYSGTISADALTVGCKRNVKPEMAELKGKRLVIAAELEEGMRLNTSIVKQLCSTDEVTAEKKYKDPFKYVPTHTLVLYTNHLPRVGANDDGIWRRLIVIPFNAKITGSSDIKNYADYLYENVGGAVLSWIIDGAAKAIKNKYKLRTPKVVEAAINKYRENNDWFSAFVEECCEVDATYTQKSGEFYHEYRSYCARTGEYTRSTTDFYTALENAGFERKRAKSGITVYGIRLKSDFLEE